MLPGSNTPPTRPETPWLKWVIIGFICFGAYSMSRPGNRENPNEVQNAFQKAAHNIESAKLLDIEDYKSKLFPGSSHIRLKEVSPGKGVPASCGQTVRIAYQTFDHSNQPLADKAARNKPLSLTIGEGKAMPALEKGVIGMRKGGKRTVMAPPALAYGIKDFAREGMPSNAPVLFDIELLDITPALPDSESTPFRVLGERSGQGQGVQCGVETTVHVTLWDVSGKKLYSTHDEGKQPIRFTPGKSQVFIGLEQGVISLPLTVKRTVIVPPVYQKTMNGNEPVADFPFPKDQTVLVDIEAVP